MVKKRVKKRTHVRKAENSTDPKAPKSFVIRTGRTTSDPTSSVLAQLVIDVRKIMEPNTAIRLRVYSPSPHFCNTELNYFSRNGMQINSKITLRWLGL